MAPKRKAKGKKQKMTAVERLRRRFAAGDFDRGGGKSTYIKIKNGTNYLRILPAASLDDEDDFYCERFRHFRQEGSLTCAKSGGNDHKPCFVCDRASSLDANSKSKLSARTRYYFAACTLAKGQKPGPVGVLEVGVTVAKAIIKLMTDEDGEYGEPWGKNFGRKRTAYDYKIMRESTGPQTFDVEYSVHPTSIFTKLPNTEEMLKSIPDLQKTFPVPTSEQLRKQFLNVDDDDEEEAEIPEAEELEEEEEIEEEDDEEEEEEIDDEEEEEEEEEEDDEEEEEEEEEDDEEEIDDDDDEAEDEDEEDDDAEEDDDDAGEDEEEEEPPPKRRGRPKTVVKKTHGKKKASKKAVSKKASGGTGGKKGRGKKDDKLGAAMRAALKKGKK